MKYLALFGDGGSRGNPGPAASGWVVYDHDNTTTDVTKIKQNLVLSSGKYIGIDTNNQAEWQALTLGLSHILDTYTDDDIILTVFMDSLLVVSQANGKWKIKHEPLRKHFSTFVGLRGKFQQLELLHVLRGFNKEADAEVNRVLDSM
jgi:ribonuclease HI